MTPSLLQLFSIVHLLMFPLCSSHLKMSQLHGIISTHSFNIKGNTFNCEKVLIFSCYFSLLHFLVIKLPMHHTPEFLASSLFTALYYL